ncbi:MAG: type II secretion system minor pseudopilin GspI [Pseudomonadota bacterium]|nr:type II secretion system minor pseudopilin GspI [Pseudomonadota bacterium]
MAEREAGFTPLRRSAEKGFTLVEMMVALAIFSLAALALLRLEGATVSNTARLKDQAIAQIVARNVAVETLTDIEAPAYGTESGMVSNAARNWTWTRIVGRSPEARIQQIEIKVASDRGPEAATLTIFRRAVAQ